MTWAEVVHWCVLYVCIAAVLITHKLTSRPTCTKLHYEPNTAELTAQVDGLIAESQARTAELKVQLPQ